MFSERLSGTKSSQARGNATADCLQHPHAHYKRSTTGTQPLPSPVKGQLASPGSFSEPCSCPSSCFTLCKSWSSNNTPDDPHADFCKGLGTSFSPGLCSSDCARLPELWSFVNSAIPLALEKVSRQKAGAWWHSAHWFFFSKDHGPMMPTIQIMKWSFHIFCLFL